MSNATGGWGLQGIFPPKCFLFFVKGYKTKRNICFASSKRVLPPPNIIMGWLRHRLIDSIVPLCSLISSKMTSILRLLVRVHH